MVSQLRASSSSGLILCRKIAANPVNARASTVPHSHQRERALHGLMPRFRRGLVREIGGVDADVEMQEFPR
jgi:hypothetical protein